MKVQDSLTLSDLNMESQADTGVHRTLISKVQGRHLMFKSVGTLPD